MLMGSGVDAGGGGGRVGGRVIVHLARVDDAGPYL